jgi:uncharacterized protein YqjF (DUF2071 family)
MRKNVPPTPAQRLADRQRPPGVVVLKQRWEQLLFLHWRWDAEAMQATLPPGLTADVWNGAAWLGLVPLFMRNVRPNFSPPIPFASNFLELNLRTYVFDESGRPGVYFYSLDCNQPVVVEAARRLLHLRYEHSEMEAAVDRDGTVDFSARRKGTDIRSKFRYRALGEAEPAAPDSLEMFLIERYRLFAAAPEGDALSAIRVTHAPYRLRVPLVLNWDDGPVRLAGFALNGRAPDHTCAAEPVDVDTFAPHPVAE